MNYNIVLEEGEIITGVYSGRYTFGKYYSRNGMFATWVITNKRLYCEYGIIKKESKLSIYFDDILEIKQDVIGTSFTIKESKKASNGKNYTNTHVVNLEHSLAQINTKVFKEIVEIIGEEKVAEQRSFTVSQVLGMILFFAFVMLVVSVSG